MAELSGFATLLRRGFNDYLSFGAKLCANCANMMDI